MANYPPGPGVSSREPGKQRRTLPRAGLRALAAMAVAGWFLLVLAALLWARRPAPPGLDVVAGLAALGILLLLAHVETRESTGRRHSRTLERLVGIEGRHDRAEAAASAIRSDLKVVLERLPPPDPQGCRAASLAGDALAPLTSEVAGLRQELERVSGALERLSDAPDPNGLEGRPASAGDPEQALEQTIQPIQERLEGLGGQLARAAQAVTDLDAKLAGVPGTLDAASRRLAEVTRHVAAIQQALRAIQTGRTGPDRMLDLLQASLLQTALGRASMTEDLGRPASILALIEGMVRAMSPGEPDSTGFCDQLTRGLGQMRKLADDLEGMQADGIGHDDQLQQRMVDAAFRSPLPDASFYDAGADPDRAGVLFLLLFAQQQLRRRLKELGFEPITAIPDQTRPTADSYSIEGSYLTNVDNTDGRVKALLAPGLTYHGRVIRPARVTTWSRTAQPPAKLRE